MKKRPELKRGDVVKLTKLAVKLRQAAGIAWKAKTSLVATNLDDDGSEANTMVTCRVVLEGRVFYSEFYRRELWYTGHNIFEPKKKSKIRLLQSSKPNNNDGREACFVCREPTKVTGGGIYNICANTKCEWYDN